MNLYIFILYGIISFCIGHIYGEFKWFQQQNPGMGFKEYLLWKGWF